MSSGYPALSDERSTPPLHFQHSKPRGGMRMFLPRERQLPSPVCPSVRRILRHLCCFIMLCYVVEAQGPPHRNQEPHKLLCDSQNASHSHLTCGIKLSQPMMRGGFKKEWWWNWNLCVLFTSLSVPGRSVLSQGVAVLTGKTLGIVDTLVWYWITHTRESVTPSCFKWACSTSSWNHISNKLAVLHFCPCVTFI